MIHRYGNYPKRLRFLPDRPIRNKTETPCFGKSTYKKSTHKIVKANKLDFCKNIAEKETTKTVKDFATQFVKKKL